MLRTSDTSKSTLASGDASEGAEVEFVMSAMDAAVGECDRRRSVRRPYRVRAALQLYADADDGTPIVLHTRDITPRGLGFITRHRLPLGYGGVVDLPDGDGVIRSVDCTLLRCREVAKGWYEGALYFNREQAGFEAV